ncbi:MAG TPA: hypothetical protein H9815_14460 [Candidatus Ruania gallistercoris]|uniref:Uncharacterized protein n=1 Tax=Candidatus Ruania gallistercoris TaxID=2838746 RepID=A0A9D2EGB0_9MICO|nr:hypothetical protein [Candidatus Ruania gallistercoris]
MDSSSTILVGGIIASEVLFWVLLFGGLAARYLLRAPRLSTVLLLGVPLADLVLVTLTLVDLAGGSQPGNVHGLAAIYLGVSVAFGHYIVRRVDGWFAHRYAGGPKPAKLPTAGPERMRHEWHSFKRMAIAWALAVPLLLAMVVVSGWHVPTSLPELFGSDPMWAWIGRASAVLVLWFATGPVYYGLYKSEPEEGAQTGSSVPTAITPAEPEEGEVVGQAPAGAPASSRRLTG